MSVLIPPVSTAAPDDRRAAKSTLLEVQDLQVRFRRHGRVACVVNGLDFSVSPGRTLAIIGESGSGKTVSCRAIMGLLPSFASVAGSAMFAGEQLLGLPEHEIRRYRGADIAMVFQDPARSLNPTMQVGKQIMEAIREHLPLSSALARQRAVELLELVRIPSPRRRFHEYPHQLSGGMRQRVMIAIALACHPKLLIADEATTALDVTTQAQIMELLLDLQRALNMALIFISHDLGLAASYSDEVIVMYAGQAVERAPTRRLFEHVRMPYTKALLEAIPRLDRPAHDVLPVVPGRPPDPSSLGSGCSFAPRCPRVADICWDSAPALSEHDSEHWWACFHPHGSGETR
jgi:oligopeptide/dipeptide ABC transporter ATP-binding protein